MNYYGDLHSSCLSRVKVIFLSEWFGQCEKYWLFEGKVLFKTRFAIRRLFIKLSSVWRMPFFERPVAYFCFLSNLPLMIWGASVVARQFLWSNFITEKGSCKLLNFLGYCSIFENHHKALTLTPRRLFYSRFLSMIVKIVCSPLWMASHWWTSK